MVASALIMVTPLKGIPSSTTERYTAIFYGIWTLHAANFSDQWWGLLAKWIRHYHSMKFFTSGMNAYGFSARRPHRNHGRTFVYDTIGSFAGMKPWLTRLFFQAITAVKILPARLVTMQRVIETDIAINTWRTSNFRIPEGNGVANVFPCKFSV